MFAFFFFFFLASAVESSNATASSSISSSSSGIPGPASEKDFDSWASNPENWKRWEEWIAQPGEKNTNNITISKQSITFLWFIEVKELKELLYC